MTDKTTAALKLAEEALNTALTLDKWHWQKHCNKALAAIREALAEQDHFAASGKPIAEQEPAFNFLFDLDKWLPIAKEQFDKLDPLTNVAYEDAVSAPKQKPVAWYGMSKTGDILLSVNCVEEDWMPLYAATVSAPKHKPIPFGQPGSREGFPPLEPLETLAYPLKECRHCGWLCTPNSGQSKKFYPLPQEREWVDLTPIELAEAFSDKGSADAGIRAVIAAFKGKNK